MSSRRMNIEEDLGGYGDDNWSASEDEEICLPQEPSSNYAPSPSSTEKGAGRGSFIPPPAPRAAPASMGPAMKPAAAPSLSNRPLPGAPSSSSRVTADTDLLSSIRSGKSLKKDCSPPPPPPQACAKAAPRPPPPPPPPQACAEAAPCPPPPEACEAAPRPLGGGGGGAPPSDDMLDTFQRYKKEEA